MSWSGWEYEFDDAASGYLTAGGVETLLQGIGAVAIFTWAAWVFVSSFNDFGRGGVSASELAVTWLRTVFLLAFISYLFVGFS